MKPNRRILLPGVGVLAVGAGTVLALLLRGGGGPAAVAASGTVEATEADLAFRIPGRLASVTVREGDRVREGQLLATLDRSALEARYRGAAARLQRVRARLAELEHGFRPEEVAQGRAAAAAAAERRADALRDLERARRLFQGGAVSREALEKAETAYRVADAAYRESRERLGILERGPRAEELAQARAAVAEAEAAVAEAEAALGDAAIEAPFDGVVTVRHREPGETVSPGLPVVTLMDPRSRWVRIYVREDRIGQVAVGQRARITSDVDPEREFPGTVIFISQEAEFTPRNVQTREERVRLVYAVKVRIDGDPEGLLKPGLPADVFLEGGSP